MNESGAKHQTYQLKDGRALSVTIHRLQHSTPPRLGQGRSGGQKLQAEITHKKQKNMR